jgi:hypothetical protein
VGRTDAHAGEPVDRPIPVEDLAASLYKKLGIDHRKHYHASGRPVPINKDGNPIRELFA